MKDLRDTTVAQVDKELQSLEAIRFDALAKVATLEQQQAGLLQLQESIEQQMQVRFQTTHECVGVRSSHAAQRAVFAATTSSYTPSPSQRSLKRKRSSEDDDEEIESIDDDRSDDKVMSRPSKRMRAGSGIGVRRIMSAAAQPAGVMTVGAIVTWTALAFAP